MIAELRANISVLVVRRKEFSERRSQNPENSDFQNLFLARNISDFDVAFTVNENLSLQKGLCSYTAV